MNLSLLTDEGPFKDQTRKASKRGAERLRDRGTTATNTAMFAFFSWHGVMQKYWKDIEV